MKTIGFTLIGHGNWSGGENYLRNMLSVIKEELSDQVEAKLFLAPDEAKQVGHTFNALLSTEPVIDARVAGAGRGRRAIKAFVIGTDSEFAELVQEHGVTSMFETAQWFGNKFPIPVISWIPDFQHRYLSDLFSRSNWWRRELGFKAQTNGNRIIMLSSQDARNDCEKFYVQSIGKTTVAQFSVGLDLNTVFEAAETVVERLNLSERYIYLPNQFWPHKNHSVVVDALAIAADRVGLERLLPVVLTGRTENNHAPDLFTNLISRANKNDVASHFRHLGYIDLEDVHALAARAEALINPSHFEGWSTSVEEAKALGVPMLLSNIQLHREQAPSASFFNPDSAEQLAELMILLSRKPRRQMPNIQVLSIAQCKRQNSYTEHLKAAIDLVESAA